MIKPLAPEQLFTACDINQFSFDTTDQLQDLKEIIGQDRAVKALQFGLGNKAAGFNVYVSGTPSEGITEAVKHFLEDLAKKEKEAEERRLNTATWMPHWSTP